MSTGRSTECLNRMSEPAVPLVLSKFTIATTSHQSRKTNLSHGGLNPAHLPCWRANNPRLGGCCFAMIGRADTEGSKSDVAMNAWLPQASYPCGNFFETSCCKLFKPKGSIGRVFAVSMRSEHRDQASFCPFALREVSVLADLALEHLRYSLTDVPPQSNFPPGRVLESDHAGVYLAIGPEGLTTNCHVPGCRLASYCARVTNSSGKR